MVLYDAMTLTLFGCSITSLLATIIRYRGHRLLFFVVASRVFFWAFVYGFFLDD